MPGEVFDAVAVAVAREEVHLRVDPRRVPAQRRIDGRERLHEVGPLGPVDLAERRHRVRHAELPVALAVGLAVDDGFQGGPAGVEPPLDPVEGRGHGGALPLQRRR